MSELRPILTSPARLALRVLSDDDVALVHASALELLGAEGAAAEAACRESVCLTGCLDFFLCTKAGWTLAASCDEEGELTIVP